MDLRQMLSERLGRQPERRALDRPRIATVLSGCALLRESFERLLLPLFQPGERLRLSRAAQKGIPHFLRQMSRIDLGSPRLQRALGVAPGFAAEMALMHGSLLRIVGQAEELFGRARRGEHRAVTELGRLLDVLERVAARFSVEEELPPEERQQAARFLSFLRGQRERASQRAEGPRERARRRVRSAEERARVMLRGRELRRMKAELLGSAAPPCADAEAPAAPRRRAARVEEADALLGTALERCLLAPPAAYAEVADALDALIEKLGPTEEGGREGGGADALLVLDLAILAMPVLDGLPWLLSEAGTSAEEMEELIDLHDAMVQMRGAAGLLLRGARDGALLSAQLVILLHEQATVWADSQEDEEAKELGHKLAEAETVLLRSAEEKEALLLRAERRIAEIEGALARELEQEEHEHTLAEVAAGKEVDEERLAAALSYKRDQQKRAARVKCRRRER